MKKAILASAFLLALTMTAAGQTSRPRTVTEAAGAQLPVVTEEKPALAISGPPVGNYKEKTEELAADIEAQKVRDKMTAPELTTAYQRFLTELIPSYNFIDAKLVRRPLGGQLLSAYHPFFNKYSFSSGPLVQYVGKWVQDHCFALKAAKVGEVGIGGYSKYQADTSYRVKDVCGEVKK
jgi:hypothetical protein